jgi:hypothetical protein
MIDPAARVAGTADRRRSRPVGRRCQGGAGIVESMI